MKKKVLALALSFVLVACATFGITLAWLKAETGEIENTFTVGKVEINLYEIDANDNTLSPTASMYTGNYKIIPGTSEKKQPYVTVSDDSEPCYVFIAVKNNLVQKSDDSVNIVKVKYTINDQTYDGRETTDPYWDKVICGNDDNIELYIYRFYVDTGDGADINKQFQIPAGTETIKLFNEIKYDSSLTQAEVDALNNKTIEIMAYAVQAENRTKSDAESMAKAWADKEFGNKN